MNLPSVLLLLLLLLAGGLALRSLWKNRGHGCSGCNHCGGCPHRGSCPDQDSNASR